MKKLLCLCSLFVAPFLAAQTFLTEYTTNDTLFKAKGTQAICRLPDHDLLIAATVWDSVPFPNQNARVVLIRTDSVGHFEGSNVLLASHTSSRDLSADSNGVYYANIGSGSYCSIIRADTAGNPQWMRHITNAPAGYFTNIQHCRPEGGGGCYAYGSFSSMNGSGDDRLWLVKYQSNGDTVWSRSWQWPGVDLNSSNAGMVVTRDKSVVVAFDASSRDSLNNYYYGCGLMKVDSSGVMQWMHCFADTNARFPMGLQLMRDSGFVLTGITTVPNNTVAREFLLRTDRNGNLLWYKYTDQFASRVPVFQRQGMVLLNKGKFLLGFTHLVTTMQSTSAEFIECDTLGQVFTVARVGGYQLDSLCISDVIESGGMIVATGCRTTLQNATSINSPNYHPLTIVFPDIHNAFCEGSVDTINVFAAPLRTDLPPAVVLPGPVSFQMTTVALTSFPFSPSGCVQNDVAEQPLPQHGLSIYPNPSGGDVTLIVDVKEADVRVYNAEGRLVYSAKAKENRCVLPSTGFAAGMYFVQVYSCAEVIASGKFVRAE